MRKLLIIFFTLGALLPLQASAAATYSCSGGTGSLAPITVQDPLGADGARVSAYVQSCQSAGGVASGPSEQQLTSPPATSAATVNTPAGSGKLVYTPLEPLPNATTASYNSLSAYLTLVFNILLSIGAMIAVLTLVLAGITYMVSEVIDKKSEARKRMQASIIGLLLLLTSWLILYTVNPNLLNLCLLRIDALCGGTTSGSSTNSSNTPTTNTSSTPTQAQITSCESQGKTIQYGDSGWLCQ